MHQGYEKLKLAQQKLNVLGAQLSKVCVAKNPNTLKFSIHQTLQDHKECVDIIKELIKNEETRYKYH